MRPDIKPRIPRPLTEAERTKLRNDQFGGDASVKSLNELASKFAKVGRDRSKSEGKSSGSLNNGWAR